MLHSRRPYIVLLGGSEIRRYTIADKIWEKIRNHFSFDFDYFIMPLQSQEDLRIFVESVHIDDLLLGGNVALPWKRDFFHLCDFHDLSTKETGIVSAFVSHFGKLTSFNMDAMAVFMALQYEDVHCEAKSVLVIGAGGAGVGLASFLVKKNNIVFLTDNNYQILEDLSGIDGVHIVSRENLNEILPGVQIIVNATTVGNVSYWGGDQYVFSSPLSCAEVQSSSQKVTFIEMNYRPYYTHFLDICLLFDRKVVPGIDMLVIQAMLTFSEITRIPFTKNDFYAIKSSIEI